MKRILVWQITVLAVIAGLSLVLAGERGLWSALAGSAVYLLPSAGAVLLLKLFAGNAYLQSRAFVAGEVLKVILSLVLMLIVFVVWHQSLAFIPFLIGLLGVSHFVFLVLLRVKDYGR